ncbi:phosphatidylethanolamine-binding protein [Podospora aff. communis PSN243]|uniref:Phosphatidylethanolamine-binding protein n=1 Tax=Podospora aff. communis PSN243 TaxID=3040156 RepID=A0AAV9G034_9PEZI|nr:phosphatidylethanolamine-binding protein [Podospora aff. communis PSN243]
MKEPDIVKQILSSLTPSDPSTSPIRAPLRIHFRETTLTTPGTHLPRSSSLHAHPPSFSVSALALDNLSFPNCDLSPTTTASSATSSSSNDSAAKTPHYLIAALDIDPPFPSFPVMGPLLHSLTADLTLANEMNIPEDGFIPLEGPSSGSEGDVVPYMGPAPPAWSTPHRYVFMMWEQPEGVTGEKIREEMGLDAEEGVGMMGRARWDQEGFERRWGLGRVVAGNYFVC